MKTSPLLAIILLFAFCITAKAATVSVGTAQTVALNFYKLTTRYNGHTPLTATLTYTQSGRTRVADFYVFNMAPVKGFVIVSAANNAPPVLAYSTESVFDAGMPDMGIRDWVKTISADIQRSIEGHLPATARTATSWQLYQQGQAPGILKATVVNPLLATTWNQSPYYNMDCPADPTNGGTSVTGCVATAMAQVMKYWAYPAIGTGTFTYTDNVANGYRYDIGTLTAVFDTTHYLWGEMPNNVTGNTPAVGILMYDCGVGVAMDYSNAPAGSSSYVYYPGHPSATNAFKWYFAYDSLTLQNLNRSNYDSATWMNIINNELVAGRPFIYTGQDPDNGGHAWVCDGYDANNLLHMNWGFGGVDNGYYATSYLDPAPYNFSTSEGILIGIEPPAAPVAAAGIGSSFACSGLYQFVDQSTGAPTQWLWAFGDGDSSTLQNPTHIYTSNGSYTVTLKVTNVYGTNTQTNTNYVTVSKAAAPTAGNVTHCSAGTFSLSATTGDQVIWYDSLGNIVSNTNPYTTPLLSHTTTYWIEDWAANALVNNTYSLGPPDFSINGNSYTSFSSATNLFQLKFSTLVGINLQSVLVYSPVATTNTVVYIDSATGTQLGSQAVTLAVGYDTLALNFSIAAGGPYYMGFTNDDNMAFANGGAAYPYADPNGVVSITGSNVIDIYGPTYSTWYPYFFNWVITEPYCISNRGPVTAIVSGAVTPMVTISSAVAGTICSNTEDTLTAIPVNGGSSPAYQWYLNGTLVSTGAVYIDSILNLNDSVWVVLTSNATCASPATATSAKVYPPYHITNGGAGTWTWTGGTSTNWFEACNWDKTSLPDLLSDVVIPGGTSFQPTITGTTGACKTITINTTNGALVTVATTNGGRLNVAH